MTDRAHVKEIAYRSVIDGLTYEVLACGHRLRARPGVAGATPRTTRHCPDCRKASRKKAGKGA